MEALTHQAGNETFKTKEELAAGNQKLNAELLRVGAEAERARRDLERERAECAEKLDELSVSLRQSAEMNEALKKLLAQSQEDARKFERRVVANVEDLVLPYVRRLQDTVLSVDQRVYVNVVEQNLTEIVAPFMRQIGAKHENLTPREIEVANLVRMGTTSKEIARLLNISKRAVEFHRDSLRKKLGLKKSKKNLRAYLAALA